MDRIGKENVKKTEGVWVFEPSRSQKIRFLCEFSVKLDNIVKKGG